MKLRIIICLIIYLGLVNVGCSRRVGCPTFDEKTQKPNLPKGNKSEANQLFGRKMDSHQNSNNRRRKPSKSKEDKSIMGN